jgi:hypothetical protein
MHNWPREFNLLMQKLLTPATAILFLGCGMLSSASHAAPAAGATPATVNCRGMDDVDQYGQLRLNEGQLIQCINQGFDPPASWRPPPGKVVTSAGAGSVLTHIQNPPDLPPRKAGALPSLSNLLWDRALKQPPWKGAPFQDGGDGCSMRTDPIFGEQRPLGTNEAFTCGGTISLNPEQFSYMTGSNRLALINNFSMSIFSRGSQGYELEQTVALPSTLCARIGTEGGGGNQWQPVFNLRTPIPQAIVYNDTLRHFVIRLQAPDPSRQAAAGKPQFPPGDPETPPTSTYMNYDVAWFDPFDPDPNAPKERFLVLAAVNGAPEPPTTPDGEPDPDGCYDVATHYIPEPAGANWTEFNFKTNAASCEVETLYPNSENCQNKMLIALLDTPQLVLEPSATAEFIPVKDTPRFITKTPQESQLITQIESRMRVSSTTFSFILPEGGTIALDNGNFLRMNAPAVISAGGRSVNLMGGGQIETRNGSVVTSYSAGVSVAPAATLPYSLRPNKKISLPAGVLLPAQPEGKIRLSVDSVP